jgi:hypothetical protein
MTFVFPHTNISKCAQLYNNDKREPEPSADASPMEKLMYNLTRIVPKNRNELSVVALVEIQKDTEPFKVNNMENPENVYITESTLNDLDPRVSDHVKKFVRPFVMNDEKHYHVPRFYLKGEYMVFYVNTTNDESQSNCKYTPGAFTTKRGIKAGEVLNDSNCKYTPAYMTIKTTKLIKEGEELLLFYDMPPDAIATVSARDLVLLIKDHNLYWERRIQETNDDDSSDLEKKSTGDKRKQRDELSEDDRDYIQVLDFERQELEVKMALAKEDFEYWEGRIQETIAKKKNILGGGEDEFSEDDRDEIQSLDSERKELEVKMAIAKRQFEYWERRIQETIAKKKDHLGGGDSDNLDLKKSSTGDKCKRRELSKDDTNEIRILDIDMRELEVKMAMAKREFEYWEGRIQETIAKKIKILGGDDSDNLDLKKKSI